MWLRQKLPRVLCFLLLYFFLDNWVPHQIQYTRQKRWRKEKGKAKENVDGRRWRHEEKNEWSQGKSARTEKIGNYYGEETHETQLHITLHPAVTWVLGLSQKVLGRLGTCLSVSWWSCCDYVRNYRSCYTFHWNIFSLTNGSLIKCPRQRWNCKVQSRVYQATYPSDRVIFLRSS